MKNKRSPLSIVLFLGVLFLLMTYFSRDNTSQSTIESKAENADAQAEFVGEYPSEKIKDQDLYAAFARSKAHLQEALKDPQKVKFIECLGVKVYNDPQPLGHPPSPEECARIKAEIEETATPKKEEKHLNESDLTVATDQEFQAIKPYIYAAETLNKTCSRAINGTIEKIQVCSQRDGAVQVLKNYGWCWKQDAEIESSKQWVKCNTEQKSSQVHNSVELQNNPLPTPQVASIDYKKEKSISEVTTKDNTEVSNNQDAQHHYYVQIGIFSDDANVKPLQDKLSDLGYKSQAETIGTDQGNKIRLRTQEFNNRNEAGIALNDIKDAGLTGMVVSIND